MGVEGNVWQPEDTDICGHRECGLTIYFSNGAVRCGRRSAGGESVKKCFAGRCHIFDMMSGAVKNCYYAMPQIITICFIPKTMLHGPAHDSIFSGWSNGGQVATASACLLYTCGQGARAVSLLDDRTLKPDPCITIPPP